MSQHLYLRHEDIYWLYRTTLQQLIANEQLVLWTLPGLAASLELRALSQCVLDQEAQATKAVTWLDQLCQDVDGGPPGEASPAMRVLVSLSDDLILSQPRSGVRDVSLLQVWSEIHHLKIAGYSTAVRYAGLLGYLKHIEVLRRGQQHHEALALHLSAIAGQIHVVPLMP